MVDHVAGFEESVRGRILDHSTNNENDMLHFFSLFSNDVAATELDLLKLL